ncbi:uncharacterized protein AB675_2647 [Cyphellophora attinorum]|uniref:Uncharacterized protein n=1 Tax=Cyphellophora attinorum TaxID=1664694 RepID=A0A0N0NRE7_9EURO|nr:uncharacterized protein AB675_2647 [Phialophora attinorum]KPI45001.1 hypothetical protein AB675_2647 [Phialophora attinorum]
MEPLPRPSARGGRARRTQKTVLATTTADATRAGTVATSSRDMNRSSKSEQKKPVTTASASVSASGSVQNSNRNFGSRSNSDLGRQERIGKDIAGVGWNFGSSQSKRTQASQITVSAFNQSTRNTRSIEPGPDDRRRRPDRNAPLPNNRFERQADYREMGSQFDGHADRCGHELDEADLRDR